MNLPNVVFIMTDDQGYGDLSCMGAIDFITPNLDRLAKNGVRFTDFYSASPVCSPSRASLLTGRYPGNAGVRDILAGHRRATGLTSQVPTIATALKKHGYNTGIIGKWHLGLAETSRPTRNGFDYFYGFMAGCIDYYSHIFYWGAIEGQGNPTHDLWENETEVYQDGEYFTDIISRKSVEFIREQSAKGAPFFLHVCYNAPHYPMHAPQKYTDRFRNLPWDRRMMAAMISAVDDGVGNICDELARCGILDNTIIFFQSDNGPSRESRNWLDGTPDPYYGGASGGLKGHKFSLFEGGIRVPAIISWGDKIPRGQVVSEPCCAIDVFPTILGAVGGSPEDYEVDGYDIMPVLTGGSASPHDMLFWEMDGQIAVRAGDFKLVLDGVLVEGEPAQAPVFLANLREDPSESRNLSDELPDVTKKLKEAAEQWRAGLEKRWETEFLHNYNNFA